jgi:two-component system chemotaxis sensor kinase CheA
VTPLLNQFVAEARELLQSVGEKLMQLEQAPADSQLMNELFRSVHTLKGNSGLFEFPDMTRVLHAAEDLMDAVRDRQVDYGEAMADRLLDAMDFVSMLCDEIETTGALGTQHAGDAERLRAGLREALGAASAIDASPLTADVNANANGGADVDAGTGADMETSMPTLAGVETLIAHVPEARRMQAFVAAAAGQCVQALRYRPDAECFFQGDDPFHTVRKTPAIVWGRVVAPEAWPPLAELDAYRCVLGFEALTTAAPALLGEHFRYVPDQVQLARVDAWQLVFAQGEPDTGPVLDEFVDTALAHLARGDLDALAQAARTMQQLCNPALWPASVLRWLVVMLEAMPQQRAQLQAWIESLRTGEVPNWWGLLPSAGVGARVLADAVVAVTPRAAPAAPVALAPAAPAASVVTAVDHALVQAVVERQRQILSLDDQPAWYAGRLKACAGVLVQCALAQGQLQAPAQLAAALEQSLAEGQAAPLLAWLDARDGAEPTPSSTPWPEPAAPSSSVAAGASSRVASEPALASDEQALSVRRADESTLSVKSLKVDQSKIDLLMNLIGEMVVAKNALPYLAQRAEETFGVRELAREIKAQYAVINRIAEEMQGAIMQVRMMPVSSVFQRFPRLVRDLSRKLGKEVSLTLEGEDTEADKNIIEALAEPLIHIVRNSLDHGLETPEQRRRAGKPDTGSLSIRASQEGDHVVIEIADDGRGIDPELVKRKAYERGLIDETALERISEREARHLIFAPGFSTAAVVTDVSGRGVGMDVVRSAVEKVNGRIELDSTVGAGTQIRIALPLSMAVTQVMIVESDGQIFGVPMEHVVETVRIAYEAIRHIKRSQAIVLRGSIVPLLSLNTLLGLAAPPQVNAFDEIAVLVVRVAGASIGLMVDDFRESVDVIQKPLSGMLAGLSAYSGSALMGNGAVLMVLNVKELI